MQNIKYIVDQDKCSGCGICAGICRTNAIEIKISERGFYRPSVNNQQCVECRVCLSKCPSNNMYKPSEVFGEVKCVYSGWTNDDKIRLKSASGGIATALSLEFMSKGYVVCGTGYHDKNKNRTKSFVATNKDEVLRFISSKYMPSQYSDIVKYVRSHLNDKILVVGLPCQIAAIRNVIGYDRKNIILVDIFCGRIVSYNLFDDYLNHLKISNVKEVNFRDKSKSWYDFSIKVESNSKTDVQDFRESLFGKFLIGKLYTQKACYECSYGSAGLADITLGDFWNKERFYQEKKGVSIIVTRTCLGEEIINNSESILVEKEDFNELFITQPQFVKGRDAATKNMLIKKNEELYKYSGRYNLSKLDKKIITPGIATKLKNKFTKLIAKYN